MKRDLAQLSNKVYDLCVVGGGIYGLFVAWDASLRGLSVALLEKGDFGHATSSNTLKIIHGGLRYLQHGDLRRMRRSIQERTVFMRMAPHLVHPLPFLIPTYGHGMRGKEILSVAMMMNDLIGFDRNRLGDPQKYLPNGRTISREDCIRIFPGVEERGLTGGVIYYDCQMHNSDRLVLSVARSAAEAGAVMANYVEVTGLLKEGARATGVSAKDCFTGEEMEIRARVVVNTCGPWLNRMLNLMKDTSGGRIYLSKAFNLLVRRKFVPNYAVGIYGRSGFKDRDAILAKGYRLFIITPWRGFSLIGTAHLPYDADPDHFSLTESEIQSFLDQVNEAYPAAGLKRPDVCLYYGGLLPMAGNPDGNGEVQLVKSYRIDDHRNGEGVEGLLSVIGVKFTESRYVAEKTVDRVFMKLGKRDPRSTTASTPLYGGKIERFAPFLSQEMGRERSGLSSEDIRHLIYCYGSAYHELLVYLEPGPPRFETISTLPPLARAEILHAIREEMGRKLVDVVFRRTELGLSGNPGEEILKRSAALMAAELKWDGSRTRKEIDEARTFFSAKASETTSP